MSERPNTGGPPMPALPDRWRQAIAASFLGRLPERTVLDLFDRAHEVEAPAHTVLYSEADDSRSARLVVVLDGLIRVYRTSRSGREVTLRHARRGDVLGLPAMVTEASPAAAQVVAAARVVFISAQTVRARAQLDSRLAWAVAEELAGSLFNIQERLAHNVFAAVRSRVARHLLDVAVNDGERLVAATSHEDTAAAIGSVREVVARTMTALRNDGLIRRVDTGIVLLDVAALAQVAEAEEFHDFRARR